MKVIENNSKFNLGENNSQIPLFPKKLKIEKVIIGVSFHKIKQHVTTF